MTDSLSDSLASFEAARARCQAKYDAMTPLEGPEPMNCGVCGGRGRTGCLPACEDGTNESENFCLRYHPKCGMCRGMGKIEWTERELKDQRDSDREDARNDR
jgi:hypothetical protein